MALTLHRFLIAFVLVASFPFSSAFVSVERQSPLPRLISSQYLTIVPQHHRLDGNRQTALSSISSRVKTSSSSLNLSPQDVIETGVSFDTFAPQFLWLLIIGAPRSTLTKKVMGPITPILGLALVHFTIVGIAALQDGALDQIAIFTEVFDPSMSQLGGMQKLFAFPNFVAQEWPHVLIWDLFVGRAIWIDGVQRKVDTRVALAFCNFIGPPGLLIHAATCLLTNKGQPFSTTLEDDS